MFSETQVGVRMPDVGQILGGCRLLRTVGSGAMAVVYEATQIRLRRRVAVKVLHGGIAREPRAIQRFLLEGEAAAALQHEGVVIVHERAQDGPTPFVIMEFVDGPDLAEVVAHMRDGSAGHGKRFAGLPGPDTPVAARLEFAVETVARIADALHHAHERGIIHRDVKPSNVLLADGRPKVSDFGLADVLWSCGLTATGEALGTPAYMSPEQALARPVDCRTDVYSLGVTLFEIVTLRRPIHGESLVDYVRRIPIEEPPAVTDLVPEVPRGLATIIEKAMRKSRDDRYATATEFAEDLRAFQRGDPIRARPESTISRGIRVARRRPATTLLLVTALVLAAATWIVVAAWPHDDAILDVRAHDGGTYPVRLVPLDPTGFPLWDEARPLGETPVEDLRVAPREYRVVVGGPGASAEIYAPLAAGERREVVARVLPASRVREGMVDVPGGDYDLPYVSVDIRKGPIRLRPFLLDRREVSYREFREFLRESGYVPSREWPTDPIPDEWKMRPAEQVTWWDARAYAAWHGKRLPTAEEWIVASGRLRNRKPTEEPSPDRECHPVDEPHGDVTALGIINMFGNVSEWTATWPLPLPTPGDEAALPPTRRVRLGRSYAIGDNRAPVCFPQTARPGRNTALGVGFRCAKTIDP